MAFFACVGRNKDASHFKDGNTLRSTQDIPRQNIQKGRIKASAECDMIFV
jgi:hypothetical protein